MSPSTTSREALPTELLDAAAPLLRVMAHPTRLRLIETLLDRRLSVGELALTLDLPQAAVSGHLTQLKAHRILRVEREGRESFYRVSHPAARFIIDCLKTHQDELSS